MIQLYYSLHIENVVYGADFFDIATKLADGAKISNMTTTPINKAQRLIQFQHKLMEPI